MNYLSETPTFSELLYYHYGMNYDRYDKMTNKNLKDKILMQYKKEYDIEENENEDEWN